MANEEKKPSLWLPMQDRLWLAILAKIIEEAGELASAAGRCIAQGVDGLDPVTGKHNGAWLAEEMADVSALIQLMDDRFVHVDTARIERKFKMKAEWLEMIRDWEAQQLPGAPDRGNNYE